MQSLVILPSASQLHCSPYHNHYPGPRTGWRQYMSMMLLPLQLSCNLNYLVGTRAQCWWHVLDPSGADLWWMRVSVVEKWRGLLTLRIRGVSFQRAHRLDRSWPLPILTQETRNGSESTSGKAGRQFGWLQRLIHQP